MFVWGQTPPSLNEFSNSVCLFGCVIFVFVLCIKRAFGNWNIVPEIT